MTVLLNYLLAVGTQSQTINSQQLSSSEESRQSKTPSHRAHGRIHWTPLAQWKSVDAQSVAITSMQTYYMYVTHCFTTYRQSVAGLYINNAESGTDNWNLGMRKPY